MQQIIIDSEFMASMGIMDYSLLIGRHEAATFDHFTLSTQKGETLTVTPSGELLLLATEFKSRCGGNEWRRQPLLGGGFTIGMDKEARVGTHGKLAMMPDGTVHLEPHDHDVYDYEWLTDDEGHIQHQVTQLYLCKSPDGQLLGQNEPGDLTWNWKQVTTGGCRRLHELHFLPAADDPRLLWHFSIIDLSQAYTLQKSAERKLKRLTKTKDLWRISSAPPGYYAKRFCHRMNRYILPYLPDIDTELDAQDWSKYDVIVNDRREKRTMLTAGCLSKQQYEPEEVNPDFVRGLSVQGSSLELMALPEEGVVQHQNEAAEMAAGRLRPSVGGTVILV